MVTRIHKMARRRLFLREHRKAKGVSAEAMAGRLGIERESLLRLERELHRVNSEKQAAYAHALDMEPEDLWRPPGNPSIDAMVHDAPENVRSMVVDIVRRMVGKAS
jgi:transcriptional regulator with XRE-family HTH domain